MERYFLVTFIFENDYKKGFGNINFAYKGFPSKRVLKIEMISSLEDQYANLKFNSNEIAISNIIEFKNEADYRAYEGK